jgi:cytochrome c biogenesis protein CcdA/thiol-disulfide isomerase/thioredoxin
MVALLLFAFVAGVGTALSPCVLPVLPVALSAGSTGGARRPLGVVTGLALSFTFASVALVYVLDLLGLPGDLLRTIAIVSLIAFGTALAIPRLADRLEAWLSRIAPAPAGGRSGTGFGSGLVVGISLGFVYAPCAGPILAGVITVSAAQPFTLGRLLTAASYGIGSAAALYVLMLGGRRLTRPLTRRSGKLQRAMGGVMVGVAVLMLFNVDTRFQTAIASHLPGFLVNPTGGLERSHSVAHELAAFRPGSHRSFGNVTSFDPDHPPVFGPAPALTGTQQWFNTPGDRPLTLAGLRRQRRVVLVDFWTYSCINCIRTLPQLKAWDAKYRAAGLTILGVHTPEFPFERDAGNVRSAISQNGLHYPVVQDNDRATWDAFSTTAWPTEYLIDTRGRLRWAHIGEGEYDRTERAIRALLAETGRSNLGGPTHMQMVSAPPAGTTPESYLGSERATRFANGRIVPGAHDYGRVRPPARDGLSYGGRWLVAPQFAEARAGARLELRFHSRRVFLVLGPPRKGASPRSLEVLLDGHPIRAGEAGADVHGSSVRVRGQQLYRLVELPAAGTHLLELRPAGGVRGYAFTFG